MRQVGQWLIQGIQNSLLLAVLTLLPETTAQNVNTAYCTSYCDEQGNFKDQLYCISETIPVYCCGGKYNRYCCVNASKEIGNNYPAELTCPSSEWWIDRWRLVVGLVVALFVVITIAFSCCYARKTQQRNGETDSQNVHNVYPGVPVGVTVSVITSNTPSPPPYTPAKEPPKYHELYEMTLYQQQGVMTADSQNTLQSQPPEPVSHLQQQCQLTPVQQLATSQFTDSDIQCDTQLNRAAATHTNTNVSVERLNQLTTTTFVT